MLSSYKGGKYFLGHALHLHFSSPPLPTLSIFTVYINFPQYLVLLKVENSMWFNQPNFINLCFCYLFFKPLKNYTQIACPDIRYRHMYALRTTVFSSINALPGGREHANVVFFLSPPGFCLLPPPPPLKKKG